MKLATMFKRKTEFRARSPERDRKTDRQIIAPILALMDTALQTFDTERLGLETRMTAAGLRASFLAGNETYEDISRDLADSELLRQAEIELKNGQTRLDQLRDNIHKLKEIRTSLLDKFTVAA